MSNINKMLDEILELAQKEMDTDQREIHVIILLQAYLKHRPEDGRTWLSYGECLRLVGRFDAALDAMLTSLELAPDDKKSTVLGRIGFLCNQHRTPQEAESWYRLGTNNRYCSDGWIWLLRGVNLSTLRNYIGALNCFTQAEKFEDVDKSEVALNCGLVQRASGEYDEALLSFNKALEIDPEYSEARKCLEGLQGISETLEKTNGINN